MNKRDVVLSLLNAGQQTPRSEIVPAGFFIHFPMEFRRGQAAIDKHLEFFHTTGMDFVKIQYETQFPQRPEIRKPADWAKMPQYGADFYQDQWNIAKGLVEAAGKEALVIQTLYSPFMLASHSASAGLLEQHLREDPDLTRKGIEIVTESMLTFVRGCIAAGVDGFYHSTQGGETSRFEGSSLFESCIKPFDLAVMEEINAATEFNILHVCDYHDGYRSLEPFRDYPGDVVNCSLQLGDQRLSGQQVSELFDRPFMGGIERLGTIATGSPQEAAALAEEALRNAPERFILGADCTLPADVDWNNIKAAIAAAHAR
jgi:uroporphyrinogen decarboxylase